MAWHGRGGKFGYLYCSALRESAGSSFDLFLMSFNKCKKSSALPLNLSSLCMKIVSSSPSISSSSSESKSAGRIGYCVMLIFEDQVDFILFTIGVIGSDLYKDNFLEPEFSLHL